MHAKAIICAISALSIGFSGLTFAQQDKDVRADQANREEHGAFEPPRASDRVRAEPPQRDVARERDRGDHRSEPDRRLEQDHRVGEHGRDAGSRHDFKRGDRVPMEYRSREYVVDDWRSHRLSAPPQGYHWIQADGNFLLVAITTGVIASILLNQ